MLKNIILKPQNIFNVFLNKQNNLTSKYILCSLFSFILIVSPIFKFDGQVLDRDFLFFVNLEFNEFIDFIENRFGLYRIIAFSFEYLIPKIFQNFPFKSYIVLIIFYLTYYILCEKILSLFKIQENLRILFFVSATSTILILPTIFTWTRTQNEFLSILISWFFVTQIIKSKSTILSSLLVVVWGILSLLSYELHFPFLIILLLSFGFISWKIIFTGIIILPLVMLVVQVNERKIVSDLTDITSNFYHLFPYIELKLFELIFSLKHAVLNTVILPFLSVIFMLFFHFLNSKKVPSHPNNSIMINLNIFSLSFLMMLLLYIISPTHEAYSINGKINWNIINIFWVNILISLVHNSKNKFLNSLMLIPIFSTMLISGILIRILKNEALSNNFHFLQNSLFKNISTYIY